MMGRRSTHTAEELKNLIIEASERLVQTGGPSSLSARAIAKDVGYTPGTLYNMFKNIDEIRHHLEVRQLQRLTAMLEQAVAGKHGAAAVHAYTTAYVGYAHTHPELWGLFCDQSCTEGQALPAWYCEALYAPVTLLEAILAGTFGPLEPGSLAAAAHGMWRLIHGQTLLTTSKKLGLLETKAAQTQVVWCVEHCLNGLTVERANVSPAVVPT